MAKPDIRRTNIYPLAFATLLGLFLVNLLGFIDTQTGSAFGCGRDWPLCNGKIIPEVWNTHIAIEFIHRLVVLADLLLLLFLIAATYRRYRGRKDIRILMGISFLAFAGEGFLGAISVLTDNPPSVLALHMGMSLIAFTSLYLWTATLRQIETGKYRRFDLQDAAPVKQMKRWTWGTLIYSFLVVYFGSYVTFTGAGGYFQGWPFPTEAYTQAGSALLIDLTHRFMALVLFVLILKLYLFTSRLRGQRKDLRAVSLQTLILVIFQMLSGAMLIMTKLNLVAFLLHVSIATLMVGSLGLLGLKTSFFQEKERMKEYNL
ncbi:heme A synthase [Thermoactinomyces sp. CICC 10521]|uniref:COX15/CtaA family protein n=1 Tax=Thermoactinomyces sp. CICC 10521 TaxID=2767426 RepID=UPI0018DB9D79|nr:COX15/CtaA family protein [Thermoactinomyces sp. CICC 10521]MBH8609033.1 heme A synthase [Thermoactinomyces sp. CICC 10521]